MLIGRRIKTEQDRAKEATKKRNKRRKHLIQTKYGQKALKHSRKGKVSCILGGVAGIVLFFLVFVAFLKKGEAGIFIGFAGIGVAACSLYGMRVAYLGFRERDRSYLTCKIGIGINGGIFFSLLGMFIRGWM